MSESDITAVLDELEGRGPRSRNHERNARFAAVRNRLIALHAKGHSWSSIAAALKAAGQKASANYLRAVCEKGPQRKRSVAVARPVAASNKSAQKAQPRAPGLPEDPNGKHFGAKGLQL